MVFVGAVPLPLLLLGVRIAIFVALAAIAVAALFAAPAAVFGNEHDCQHKQHSQDHHDQNTFQHRSFPPWAQRLPRFRIYCITRHPLVTSAGFVC